MADKFNDKLIEILKKDLRFVDEEDDSLLRNEIANSALKADKELVGLLIKNKEVREAFFDKIEDYWIFNINKFIDYVQDKNFLSNSYTQFKNKIGLTIDNKHLGERGEISLVWPFKDCVLEAGMTKEDQKRNEIFFNQTLAKDEIDRLFDPKVLTNFKKYTEKGEEKVKDFSKDEKGIVKDNLIIKGNNLLALHSLRKQFAGRIKLIYIDPPYNTQGSAETFTYNNTFNHSTWLTFMRNRLEIAKELLREDGFITITIDHYEILYLGVLADEVFGRDNRLGIITIVHKPEGRNQEKYFGTSNEFMLVYAKNKLNANFNQVALSEEIKKSFDKRDEKGLYRLNTFINKNHGQGGIDTSSRKNRPEFWYPIYVSKDLKEITLEKKNSFYEIFPISNSGNERTWRTKQETFLEKLKDNLIVAEKVEGKIQIFEKYYENQIIKTHWIDKRYNANIYGRNLLEKTIESKSFSYPKSLYAVLDTLKIMTLKEDIIMDFFAGSGTTGHATLELNKEDGGNRQFILIEQLDTHADVIRKRITKVLENDKSKESFIYCELLKYNEEAIEKIQEAKDTKTLLKIWDEMCEKYFLNYDVEIKKFNDNKKEFEKLSLTQQKKLLIEMLNKNQLYVNLPEIGDSQFKISKEDKELNKKFYGGK